MTEIERNLYRFTSCWPSATIFDKGKKAKKVHRFSTFALTGRSIPLINKTYELKIKLENFY